MFTLKKHILSKTSFARKAEWLFTKKDFPEKYFNAVKPLISQKKRALFSRARKEYANYSDSLRSL